MKSNTVTVSLFGLPMHTTYTRIHTHARTLACPGFPLMPNSHADMERTLMAGSARPPSPIAAVASKATDTPTKHVASKETNTSTKHTPPVTDPSPDEEVAQQRPMPTAATMSERALMSGVPGLGEI